MKLASWITSTYALLVMMGGAIGFFLAGSEPSLWMGLIFGLLLLLSAYTMNQGKYVGLYTAVTLMIVLTVFFGYRYTSSGSIVPSGIMMLLSMLALGTNFLTLKCSEK